MDPQPHSPFGLKRAMTRKLLSSAIEAQDPEAMAQALGLGRSDALDSPWGTEPCFAPPNFPAIPGPVHLDWPKTALAIQSLLATGFPSAEGQADGSAALSHAARLCEPGVAELLLDL